MRCNKQAGGSGLAALAMVGLCLATGPTMAAEGGVGVYVLGSRGPLAGALPPPGLYFQNDLYYYKGSASPTKTLPFHSQVIGDVRAEMVVNAPSLLWSTPLGIAGGNVAFGFTLPIGGPTIDAGFSVTNPALGTIGARNLQDSVTTVGDPLLSALIGWHSGNFHWNTGVTVNVPIGHYRSGALANMAFHRWAVDVSAAVTWLDPKIGLDLSAAAGFTFNGRNPATDYVTGTEFHLEASAVQHLSRNFDVGLVGYYYRQISDDWGGGARLGGFRGEVIALGGTAGVTFNVAEREVMTRVKVYREFNVSNRVQGTAAFFTVSLPLTKPMAPPPPPN